jgi:hypothetical protein
MKKAVCLVLATIGTAVVAYFVVWGINAAADFVADDV